MNLDNLKYNLIYTVNTIPNIVLPFFAGIIISKLGSALSLFYMGLITLIGQLIFTEGMNIKNYELLLVGN